MDEFERTRIYGGYSNSESDERPMYKKVMTWMFIIFLNVCLVAFIASLVLSFVDR